MLGLVAFEPASQLGTGTSERVTMTSGAAEGQPGFAVMVVVTETAGAADAAGMLALMVSVDMEAAEYWLARGLARERESLWTARLTPRRRLRGQRRR